MTSLLHILATFGEVLLVTYVVQFHEKKNLHKNNEQINKLIYYYNCIVLMQKFREIA